ncbi:MAG: hypothetical protein AVDCRST_MAG66-4749, partial [uncultured Pseudonocardia sp.]
GAGLRGQPAAQHPGPPHPLVSSLLAGEVGSGRVGCAGPGRDVPRPRAGDRPVLVGAVSAGRPHPAVRREL